MTLFISFLALRTYDEVVLSRFVYMSSCPLLHCCYLVFIYHATFTCGQTSGSLLVTI